jgi:hypothetical protein
LLRLDIFRHFPFVLLAMSSYREGKKLRSEQVKALDSEVSTSYEQKKMCWTRSLLTIERKYYINISRAAVR